MRRAPSSVRQLSQRSQRSDCQKSTYRGKAPTAALEEALRRTETGAARRNLPLQGGAEREHPFPLVFEFRGFLSV